VPARVLNLVCVVDKGYSGEIANRLRKVGRYHPSRTIVCQVEPRRDRLDAVATLSAPSEVLTGEIGLPAGDDRRRRRPPPPPAPRPDRRSARGQRPGDLRVGTARPRRAVDSLLSLAQVVLADSVDAADPREAIERARELEQRAYVVDLAWLRSTPWRERIAAAFDPPALRTELGMISAITINHHPDSAVAALLLVGWLASRLDWQLSPLVPRGDAYEGKAHGRRQDVVLRLVPHVRQQVPGLAGLEIETAGGRTLSLERGPGGLHAREKHRRGPTREWTILGASRGEEASWAKASGRRCCATRRTGRRSAPPARC